jgi:4-amino-4-deoxy-L-arabinose transferase-like glycosyltransferase
MTSEDILGKRIDRLKGLIKDKRNAILIWILTFAFLIRLYYFFISGDQALWWDSLVYGALAENFITHSWTDLPIIAGEILGRPPLLPLLWSFLMRLSFNEMASKLLLEIIPSVLSVFFAYLIISKNYNYKVGLLASGIFSFMWMHLFYSMRMLTSVPALCLALASAYCFLKSGDNFKTKDFTISILLLSFSFLMRYPIGLLFGASYFFFIIITQKHHFLKKKSFWKGGLIGIAPIIIFFALNLYFRGSIFPPASIYSESLSKKGAFAFYTLGFIPHILQQPLFVFFLIGSAIAIFSLILGFDLISRSKEQRGHLLNLLFLLLTLSFQIFYIKAAEDRYLFPMILPLLSFTSIGILYVYTAIKKYSKQVAIAFIILVLCGGAYSNLTFGDSMIRGKASSFYDIKQAFLWLEENAPKGSRVIGETSSPYVIYYTDLIPVDFPESSIPPNYSPEADYLVVSAYHWHQDYLKEFIPTLQPRLEPVFGTFFDEERQNPSVVIYRFRE